MVSWAYRVTDEGIQGLSVLTQLRSLSYGYTSMPEADDVVAAIARQFTNLTGVGFACKHCQHHAVML